MQRGISTTVLVIAVTLIVLIAGGAFWFMANQDNASPDDFTEEFEEFLETLEPESLTDQYNELLEMLGSELESELVAQEFYVEGSQPPIFRTRSQLMDRYMEEFSYPNELERSATEPSCGRAPSLDLIPGLERGGGAVPQVRCFYVSEIFYGTNDPAEEVAAMLYDGFTSRGWISNDSWDRDREEIIDSTVRKLDETREWGFGFEKHGVAGLVGLARPGTAKRPMVYDYCDEFCEVVEKHGDAYDLMFELSFRIDLPVLKSMQNEAPRDEESLSLWFSDPADPDPARMARIANGRIPSSYFRFDPGPNTDGTTETLIRFRTYMPGVATAKQQSPGFSIIFRVLPSMMDDGATSVIPYVRERFTERIGLNAYEISIPHLEAWRIDFPEGSDVVTETVLRREEAVLSVELRWVGKEYGAIADEEKIDWLSTYYNIVGSLDIRLVE